MKKITTLAFFLIASLALGGCWPLDTTNDNPIAQITSPSPETIVPEPIQACELLTKTEIEAIVGESLSQPKQSPFKTENSINHQGCIYLAASGAFTPTVHVDISQVPFSDQQLLEVYWSASESAERSSTRYSEILDIGTRAYFTSQHLKFQIRNYIVTITTSLSDVGKNREASKAIAELILTNWPEN